MGIFSNLFTPAGQTEDGCNVFTLGGTNTGDLTTPAEQYNEGYLKNPYVKRACDLYGVRLASIDQMFFDTAGDEIDPDTSNDPFIELMQHPNPLMDGREFMQRIGTSYGIFGEAFIYPEKTPAGWTLWLIDPMQISPETTASDLTEPVRIWRCTKGVHGKTVFNPSEIIHIKNPRPDVTNARGLSPMTGCAKSVLLQNAIRDWNIATTRNGAKPYVALTIPNQITPDNRTKLQNELNAKGGTGNAGRGIVLDNGKDLKVLGMTAVEMDFANSYTQCGKDIAIAYGIPPEKLGDSATKTYSNSVEASREEITNTILPLCKLVYDPIWAFFKGYNIAKGIGRFTFDIEQLTDNMGIQQEMLTALQTVTFLTANEKRKKLGYEPMDNPIADELMMSPADTPMSDYSGVPLDNGDDLFQLMQ